MRLRNLIIGLAVALLTALWSAPVAFAQDAGHLAPVPTVDVGDEVEDIVKDVVEDTVKDPVDTVKDVVEDGAATVGDAVKAPVETVKDVVDDVVGGSTPTRRGGDGDKCDRRDLKLGEKLGDRECDRRFEDCDRDRHAKGDKDRCDRDRHRHGHDGRGDDDDDEGDDDEERDSDEDSDDAKDDEDDEDDSKSDDDDSSNFPVGAPETGGGPVGGNVGALFTLGLTGMAGSSPTAFRRTRRS